MACCSFADSLVWPDGVLLSVSYFGIVLQCLATSRHAPSDLLLRKGESGAALIARWLQ